MIEQEEENYYYRNKSYIGRGIKENRYCCKYSKGGVEED